MTNPWNEVPFCHHGNWFGDCKELCACGHTCEEHRYLDDCYECECKRWIRYL